jgi:glycosyltransferase involved in cell wall biosynthesis
MTSLDRSLTRLRIAYITNSIAIGGMEKHVFDLATAVVKAGHHVTAIAPGTPGVAPFIEWFRSAGIDVHTVDLSGAQPRRRLAIETRRLWRLLRSNAIDVFHQHRTGPYHGKWACLAARAAGVPAIVATEHLPAHRLSGTTRLVNAAVDRVVDRVVTVCDLDRRQQLRETWRPGSKVVAIHNGIDIARFQPDAALEQRARAAFGVGRGPVLGVIARLAPAKGITHLLKALPELAAKWPELLVLVAGDGPLRHELEAEVAALGVMQHVRFLGHQTNAVDILRAIDLLVLPSEVESFPLVILEAMAMCRPVVASNVGGVSEAVIDGETGFVVPPRTPQALAAAIERCLLAPNFAEMGMAARQRVAELFTVDVMAAKATALYRSLLRSSVAQSNGH